MSWDFLMATFLVKVRWNLNVLPNFAITFLIVLVCMQNNDFLMTFYTYMSLYFGQNHSSITLLHPSPSSLPSSLWIIPQSLAYLYSSHTCLHTHMYMRKLSLTMSHMYTYTRSCVYSRLPYHTCKHTHVHEYVVTHHVT